jgi:hypothetical protein
MPEPEAILTTAPRPLRWPRLKGGGWSTANRPHRVAALLVGVVMLSLGDLYMTLVHLLNFGMLEGNPVARTIMEHGSPAALVIWKLLTVGFAVGVLFWARRLWAAEAGAVFCCCVLTWLTFQWVGYSDQISRLTHELHVLAATQEDPKWVTMVPGS